MIWQYSHFFVLISVYWWEIHFTGDFYEFGRYLNRASDFNFDNALWYRPKFSLKCISITLHLCILIFKVRIETDQMKVLGFICLLFCFYLRVQNNRLEMSSLGISFFSCWWFWKLCFSISEDESMWLQVTQQRWMTMFKC